MRVQRELGHDRARRIELVDGCFPGESEDVARAVDSHRFRRAEDTFAERLHKRAGGAELIDDTVTDVGHVDVAGRVDSQAGAWIALGVWPSERPSATVVVVLALPEGVALGRRARRGGGDLTFVFACGAEAVDQIVARVLDVNLAGRIHGHSNGEGEGGRRRFRGRRSIYIGAVELVQVFTAGFVVLDAIVEAVGDVDIVADGVHSHTARLLFTSPSGFVKAQLAGAAAAGALFDIRRPPCRFQTRCRRPR